MPRLADPNGVEWDVQAVGSAFTASVFADSRHTYVNQGDAVDDQELTEKANLTWPKNGEPVIIGQRGISTAKAVIDGFARTAKGTMAARVREKSPPGQTPVAADASLLPFLLLVAVVYFADN